MTHIIIHLFAHVGVGFCHLQLRRSSTKAMVARISPAEQGVLVTPFFPFRLTLGWNRSGSLQRKIYIQESWISMFPAADNQQARGDRSRKELADVDPGSYCSFRELLLLFSCSAVPDGQSHPACCILVYHSRHCLAVQEGGRRNCQG